MEERIKFRLTVGFCFIVAVLMLKMALEYAYEGSVALNVF